MSIAPTTARGRRRRELEPLLLAAAAVAATAGVVLLVWHGATSPSGSKTVTGSGIAASQTRSVPQFDAVDLAGSNVVAIRGGAPQAVIVHADDNLLSHVTTRVETGRLVIGNEPGSFRTRSAMLVEIGVPRLVSVTLSGSGSVSLAGVRGSRLIVDLEGSGVVRGAGTADRLDVDVAGSGSAQLAGLVARDVRVRIAGSGTVLVTATRSLDASVPGSGDVRYRGHPAVVRTSVTGSGAVTPG